MANGCGASGRVQVFARARPLSSQEATFGQPCVALDESAGTVKVRNEGDAVERVLQGQAAEVAVGAVETRNFAFDGAFPPDATQREVFSCVALPVLRECLLGYNGAILAYGQTGSGKTHSLLHQGQRGEDAGILPRLVANLFVHIAQDTSSVYHVEAAALQVYNEQIDDLLHPEHQAGQGHGLTVQNGGAVPGLTWLKCPRPEALLEAFTRARTNVVYAETKMNKASSRSHAIFQIRITKRQRATTASAEGAAQKMACTHSRLSVVDLAGSERVKRSGVEGAQFREATAINKSLLAFGNVVSALAAKKAHVPFRDSKLTRILDGSIGGNCKTALLVCASPSMDSAHETFNTFEFASRAMRVEVDAKVNESIVEVGAKALLADLNGDLESDFAVPLGPELEALRKASNEASQRAEAEARRREEVTAEAKGEAAKLRHQAQAAAEALERARCEHGEEAARLRLEVETSGTALARARDEQAEEASRLLRAVADAEEALRHEQAERLAEVGRLQSAAASAEEALRREQAERATEASRIRDLTVEVEKFEAEMRHSLEEASRLRDAAADAERRVEEYRSLAESHESRRASSSEAQAAAEDRATAAELAAAEWEDRAHAAEAASARASEEADRLVLELASVRQQAAEDAEAAREAATEAALLTASAEADHLRASEALAAASAEATCLEGQVEEATRRCERLEKEMAHRTEDLHTRSLALDNAAVQLELLKAEADERESRLRQEHAAALRSSAAVHADEVGQLRAEHEEALDEQREAFEARLDAGRQEFEVRLSKMQAAAEQERLEWRRNLDDHHRERCRAEAEWQANQEHALQQLRGDSECRQRRLSAAFSAARCVAAAKESDLRASHDELKKRFASRESREEDTRRISEQRTALSEQRLRLREQEHRVEALTRDLRNRDASDRIFGGGCGEMRRGRAASASPGPPAPGVPRLSPASSPGHEKMPPLPGKKLSELAQPFQARRRRVQAAFRCHSADQAHCDFPVLVR